MLYSKLCEIYEKLESTTKGLEKTKIIADFLENLKKEPETIYLLQGRFVPDYDERESGISEQLAIKALSRTAGIKEEQIVKEFKKTGDLGLTAEIVCKNKKQSSLFSEKLTTEKVLENLKKLPETEGKGAVDRKMGIIIELLNSASSVEAKYIIRTLLGDLKVGIGSGLLRDAIVEFAFQPKDITEKKAKGEILQNAYDKVTDFAEIFEKAIKGEKELNKIMLSPGKPVKVMLFPKAKNIDEAFEIVGKPAAFEYKYDGFRMMINKDEKGKINIFTRRLDNVTKQFPEAVKFVKENVKADSFIIDSEAVGYNHKTKKYRPFQDISQRIKRKYDIELVEKELPVELNIFDIIYYNGESLIDKPFEERRKLIEKIIKVIPFKIRLSEQIITSDEKEAEEFYDKALNDGQEGLMAKNLKAIYKPGARIGYAVKLKPDPNEFDLVITGAEYGTGKRAGWLTSFDVSCRDKDNELQEIGKVSTGLKEKARDFTSPNQEKEESSGVSSKDEGLSFIELTKELKKIIISEKGKHIQVKPELIVTVGYQNIQASPTYTSGFALRFPRMIALRPDRGVKDIAALEDIKREAKKEQK
jgi:DNA ligase-1